MNNNISAFRRLLVNGSYFPGSSNNCNIKDISKLAYLQMQMQGYMVVRWVPGESFLASGTNS